MAEKCTRPRPLNGYAFPRDQQAGRRPIADDGVSVVPHGDQRGQAREAAVADLVGHVQDAFEQAGVAVGMIVDRPVAGQALGNVTGVARGQDFSSQNGSQTGDVRGAARIVDPVLQCVGIVGQPVEL